eukprot:scaffold116438_cov36-Phaeocystis_antarctica.AAC.1
MSGIFFTELCLRKVPSRAMLRLGEVAGGWAAASDERLGLGLGLGLGLELGSGLGSGLGLELGLPGRAQWRAKRRGRRAAAERGWRWRGHRRAARRRSCPCAAAVGVASAWRGGYREA